MEETLKILVGKALEIAAVESLKVSLHGQAVFLELKLSELYNCSISYKSLERYSKGIGTPRAEVLNALAKYVGYNSFEEYVKSRPKTENNPSNSPGDSTKKNQTSTILLWTLIGALVISISWNFFGNKKTECMVWKEDHYELTECAGSQMEKPLNAKTMERLKQITVCDTVNFFENGKPIIWYDKNNKVLTYFTSHGIHPENGKTLKPITPTIIGKYVQSCK